MNAIVNGAELGRMLRPEKPWNRDTIHEWTVRGVIPRSAVIHNGRRILYSVPRLIASGWLHDSAAAEKKADAS